MNGRVSYDGVFLNGNISLNKDMKLEEIEVSENGVYTPSVGYDGISKATVDVEANVESLTVNSNGTYTPPSGVDGWNSVEVNVPQTIPVLDTLNVNTNGTYTPPSGVDGYDNVVVNVQPTLDTLNVNTNGTYTPPSGVDGYNNVVVNVPSLTLVKNLDNKEISDNSQIITVDLDVPLVTDKLYLLSIYDNGNYKSTLFTFADGIILTGVVPFDNNSTMRMFTNSVTLNGYSGDYRVMYGKITEVPSEMIY